LLLTRAWRASATSSITITSSGRIVEGLVPADRYFGVIVAVAQRMELDDGPGVAPGAGVMLCVCARWLVADAPARGQGCGANGAARRLPRFGRFLN
jgi:hypothetical protein